MSEPPALGPVTVRRVSSSDDRAWCGALMAGSEPWLTLGRDEDACMRLMSDQTREIYIARSGEDRVGFVVLTTTGAFPGYVQSICVSPIARDRGIGSCLLDFAEVRIFRSSPNVFVCVSSFNENARRLYERRGYSLVGVLESYLVADHDEFLFRKSRGPWSAFRPGG